MLLSWLSLLSSLVIGAHVVVIRRGSAEAALATAIFCATVEAESRPSRSSSVRPA